MFGQTAAQPQQPQVGGGQTSIFGNNNQPTNIFGQQQQPAQQQQQPLASFGLGMQQPNQQVQPNFGGLQAPQGQQNLLQPQQGLQQPQGQPQQQQLQQQQQQQQPQQQQQKSLNIQQIKTETNKHIENLTKALINKEKIDKNQKNLQLIEKNALKSFQQQQKPQQPANTGLILGFSNPQQQQPPKPPQKVDPRNHTARVEKLHGEWTRLMQRIAQKQEETLKLLENFNQLLASQDTYYDIDEESLIDLVNQLRVQLDTLEIKAMEAVQMQEEILGLNKDESAWDQVVNNLSECLMLLDQQTVDVEEQLKKVEELGRIANK